MQTSLLKNGSQAREAAGAFALTAIRENLIAAVNAAARAVDNRPYLPVLANVLIRTLDDRTIVVEGTNLEQSVTVECGARITQQGAITLPVRTLSELIGKFSGERIDMVMNATTNTVAMRSGTDQAELKGLPVTEFPKFPSLRTADFLLPAAELKRALEQVLTCISREDSRPILTGVYMEFKDSMLTLAAADGYRLAVRTLALDKPIAKPREVVVPGRNIQSVIRLIDKDADKVGIALPDSDNTQILFRMERAYLHSQLLEGRFPDFGAIIPKTFSTQAVVNVGWFKGACERAEIFARDSANSARLVAKPATEDGVPGELMIVGKSAERGNNEGMIDAKVEGEPLEASFNIRYLIDCANGIDTDKLVLESNGAAHPGVIRPDQNDNLVYVIMPMGITR